MNKYLQKGILFCLAGVAVVCSLSYNEYKIKKDISTNIDLSETWTNDVLSKKYDDANSIKQNGGYKINLDKYSNAYTGTIYKSLLDNVVDKTSITAVRKVSDGKYEYDLSVPVWGINKDSASNLKPSIEDLSSKFTQKFISEDEYNKQLSTILVNGLNSCLTEQDRTSLTVTLETKSVNNTATLYYTSDFILSLLNTSKSASVLEWYKSEIDFYLTK